jgi:hypothetical protein
MQAVFGYIRNWRIVDEHPLPGWLRTCRPRNCGVYLAVQSLPKRSRRCKTKVSTCIGTILDIDKGVHAICAATDVRNVVSVIQDFNRAHCTTVTQNTINYGQPKHVERESIGRILTFACASSSFCGNNVWLNIGFITDCLLLCKADETGLNPGRMRALSGKGNMICMEQDDSRGKCT